MTVQQSESSRTPAGSQFGCIDYRASYSGQRLVPLHDPRVGNECSSIVLRNAPSSWTWQMLGDSGCSDLISQFQPTMEVGEQLARDASQEEE